MVTMQLINKVPGESKKGILVEKGQLVVVLDKHVSGLKHRKHILCRRYFGALVKGVRGVKGSHHWDVLSQLPKKPRHASWLDHHLAFSNVAYISRPIFGHKERRGRNFFHVVRYAHITNRTSKPGPNDGE